MSEGTRINKYLSESGVCSRREADRQIQNHNVTIDGIMAEMGSRVLQGQEVCYCGSKVTKEEEMILLVVNKPAGIVCTAEKREKNNIVEYVNFRKRVYPIGRLDKDSSGLILMTNQGEIVNKMMRSGNMHEKEYLVTVNKPISQPFLKGMASGVPLAELGVTTRTCKVTQEGKKTFRIILTQGYNRQIRRMCEYFGYHVQELTRVRIMNFTLDDLPVGEYRNATPKEIKELSRLIAKSSNEPLGAENKNGHQGKEQNYGSGKKNQRINRENRVSQ